MNCPNCSAKLSCGCQKRTASNGKQCCTACITQCNQSTSTKSTLPRPPAQAYNPKQVTYPPGPYRQ